MAPNDQGERSRGFFVTLEGPDGCGKTTIGQGLAGWLRDRGYQVVLTREPGGTPLGAGLRALLLDARVHLAPMAELFMLAADRAQHVYEVVRPALASGRIVISDRYADSSWVYQGYAGSVALEAVRRVNELATGGLHPDLTVVLDVEPAEAERRRARKSEAGWGRDRFEGRGRAFQERVRAGFLRLAAEEPHRIVIVRNEGPVESVCERIGEMVVARLAERTAAGGDGR